MSDNNEKTTTSEGKRYVIKGTPITDPYTGKPRMVIEEEKHYDGPIGFPIAALSFLLCLYSIFRGNTVAIIITAAICVISFIWAMYSMADGNWNLVGGIFIFLLCAALMLVAIFGALFLLLYLIMQI